jgi:hypothetical protein
MEELNLHLAGDIHAISAANNATSVLSFGQCWLTECQTRRSVVGCTDGTNVASQGDVMDMAHFGCTSTTGATPKTTAR